MSAKFIKLENGKKYINLDHVHVVRFSDQGDIAFINWGDDMLTVTDPAEISNLRFLLERKDKHGLRN